MKELKKKKRIPHNAKFLVSVSRPVLHGIGPPFGPMAKFKLFFSLTGSCFFMYGALSEERTGL
jgi:hypothetical protein